jgi:hypothetical protein
MVFALAAWVGLAAAYLLFAGQVSGHELIAGLGASLLAGAYAVVAHHAAVSPLRLRLPWLRVVAGVARDLVVDTSRVGAALLRPRAGALAEGELPAGDGRRAVAILALSVAPNGFVVRAGDHAMAMHRLVEADRTEAPR